jgi:hypothetical protein
MHVADHKPTVGEVKPNLVKPILWVSWMLAAGLLTLAVLGATGKLSHIFVLLGDIMLGVGAIGVSLVAAIQPDDGTSGKH